MGLLIDRRGWFQARIEPTDWCKWCELADVGVGCRLPVSDHVQSPGVKIGSDLFHITPAARSLATNQTNKNRSRESGNTSPITSSQFLLSASFSTPSSRGRLAPAAAATKSPKRPPEARCSSVGRSRIRCGSTGAHHSEGDGVGAATVNISCAQPAGINKASPACTCATTRANPRGQVLPVWKRRERRRDSTGGRCEGPRTKRSSRKGE